MTEDPMEELADAIIVDLRDFIDTEQQMIQADHELHAKLEAVDNVIMHLQESISEDNDDLQTLNHAIYKGILAIREYVEENSLQDIQFIREEQEHLKKLSDDVAHKDWRVVRTDVEQTREDADTLVRINEKHLKEFHKLFVELIKNMEESKVIKALQKSLGEQKAKEEYEHSYEHYFAEIYKFLAAYERILRDMLDKEHKLSRNLS